MDKSCVLKERAEHSLTRRAFAKRTMVGGLAAAGAVALDGSSGMLQAQGVNDFDILAFALNLEYLEAEFYTVGLTGRRIDEIGIGVEGAGRSGATVGGAQVSFDAPTRRAMEHIALDEQNHVTFLRSALRSAVVAKPAINLEALGLGFRNQQEFLTLARAFEDLGMSAYAGAVGLIANREFLSAGARIGLTEAQHVGTVRYLVAQGNFPVPMVDNMDVPPLGSPAGRLFQVDGNGLSTVRTVAQVLAVAAPFFPDGLNGRIR